VLGLSPFPHRERVTGAKSYSSTHTRQYTELSSQLYVTAALPPGRITAPAKKRLYGPERRSVRFGGSVVSGVCVCLVFVCVCVWCVCVSGVCVCVCLVFVCVWYV